MRMIHRFALTALGMLAIAMMVGFGRNVKWAPHIVPHPDGSYFVPPNSALGPPISQIRTFVTFDGTVCIARGPAGHLNGLDCRRAR